VPGPVRRGVGVEVGPAVGEGVGNADVTDFTFF